MDSAAYEVTDLEQVPEALRPLYIETENDAGETVHRFNIDVASKKLTDFDKTVGQRQEARKALADVTASLGGKKPEQIMERLAELEAAEKERSKATATKKGDFDKLKKELESEHQRDRAEWEKKNTKLANALTSALIDTQAMAEMSAMGAKAKALLPHVRSKVKVVELENGNHVVRVTDPDGGEDGFRTHIRSGEPMTIRHLLEEMAEDDDFKPLFPDDGRAGSGAPPKSASGGAQQALKRSGVDVHLTREEAKDVPTYRRAREQAEKSGGKVIIAEE